MLRRGHAGEEVVDLHVSAWRVAFFSVSHCLFLRADQKIVKKKNPPNYIT